MALWQVSQAVTKPAATWFGLVAAWYSGLVAAGAVARRALKTPPTWQAAHCCAAWTPTSGNEASWSKTPWSQLVSETLWQVSQTVGKPAVR